MPRVVATSARSAQLDDQAVLAARNARWYFTGLAASLVGNSAMSLVAGIWVKALTGSSAEAGLVSACAYAPALAAPAAGLIADRVSRRRWLIAVNLASAAAMLPLLAVRSRAGTWVIFAAMTAYGIEATLIDPAEDALFAEMFTIAFRRRITGWRLAIQETGRLIAPLLGAALFTLVGGGAVATLDAATFLVAAGATSKIRLPRAVSAGSTEAPHRRRLGADLAAGARHIWSLPELRTVVLAATAVMALSGTSVAAQYSLVTGIGERPAFLGVLTALLGAGSIVASLSASRLIARFGERRLALVGLVDFAVGDLVRATHWLPAALLSSIVLGFALPYVFLATLNLAQRLTPNELQGRVSAALTLALFGPAAPMMSLGSLLIVHATYIEIYVGSAVFAVAIAAWLGTYRDTDSGGADGSAPSSSRRS